MKAITELKYASLGDIASVISHISEAQLRARKHATSWVGHCYVCGQDGGFSSGVVLNDDLAEEWTLTRSLRKSFDIRESTKCNNCSTALRSNLHARAILEVLGIEGKSLSYAVAGQVLKELQIAEINFCGGLHKVLKDLPNLSYSEYASEDKTIRHENLHSLTYADNSFDIVLTSDTLEHVPNWEKAIKEIHRVLKPGGHHIFTIPAILTRKTRTRAVMENDKIVRLLPSSYHGCTRNVSSDDYLVYSEFGADFIKEIDQLAGFNTKVYYANLLHLSDPNIVFVSTKITKE